MTAPTVQVFIPTTQKLEDIASVINLWTGTSRNGLKAKVTVFAQTTQNDSWDKDYSMVMDAFSRASPDAYVIICKDTSVSAASPSTILDVIEATIISSQESGNEFDLFYMAAWADRCELYSNKREIGRTGLKLVETVAPNGVQCIMFSPAGVAKFRTVFDSARDPVTDRPLGAALNARITSKTASMATDTTVPPNMQRFYAVTCTPHIIQFDITKAKSEVELMKAMECRDPPKSDPPKPKASASMGLFWFIVVVIIVILLIWALVALGTRYIPTKTVITTTPAIATTAAVPATSTTIYPASTYVAPKVSAIPPPGTVLPVSAYAPTPIVVTSG